ncbi:armadillo-type protein [Aspergillus egyptiacus]|nr:armadillo-type protein [Aspergillus egyptiacus]
MRLNHEKDAMQGANNLLPDNHAQHTEMLHCPSLNKLFAELQQLPPAIDSPRNESLPVEEQEALLGIVEDALKKAEQSCDATVFEEVPSTLSKLWDCQSPYLVQATEALANGSRNPSFRPVYGQTGILSFFLRLIASKKATEDDLVLHCLRLIGNSCADTDENRATVVKDNYTSSVLLQLLRPKLIQVVIPVIYNTCIDFEPAQTQLAANKVVYILLKLAKDGAFHDSDGLLGYVYDLIELVGEQEQGIENSPDATISLLTALALDREADISPIQFCCLANTLVAYLNNERFQKICISRVMVADILSVLQHSFSFNSAISSEDAQAFAQSRLKLNQALAELSASPLFAEVYPLDSALSQTLKTWLTSTEDQLQICSCIMLGNLARSDEVCETMVKQLKVHKELIAILKSKARGAVLHSALGFLRNLAIASDNRLYLGEAGIIPAIASLWGYETVPQVQLAATSIARQLVIASAENISRLLEPPTASSGEYASNAGDSDSKETYLSLLLALFEKTDSTPIKTEIGRIVASLCRTLVTKPQPGEQGQTEAKPLLDRLFALHKGIALPLGAMATQTQWPVVRSEAWFALALMASTEDGAKAAVHCLREIDGFALIEKALSAEGPSEDGERDKVQWSKDLDNIIVLVQEVLKNDPDAVDASSKTILQDLMEGHVSKYLKKRGEDAV